MNTSPPIKTLIYVVCFQKYCTFEEVDILTNVTKEANVSVSVDGTTRFIMENVTEEIMLTEKLPLEKCKLRVLEPRTYHINPLYLDFI